MKKKLVLKKEDYIKVLLDNSVRSDTIMCSNPNCKSTDVKTWEKATRSADEGVSIFFKCNKCGYTDIIIS